MILEPRVPGDLTLGTGWVLAGDWRWGQTYRSRQMRVPWCFVYVFLALAREGLVICRDVLLSESRLYHLSSGECSSLCVLVYA